MPAGNGEQGKSFEMQDMTKREDTKEREETKEMIKEEEKGMPDQDTSLSYLEEENERLRAELEGMKEALRVAMNTAASAKDQKIPEKKNNASFVNMKMLSIGNAEYYKSLKIYSCFDCAECCFPSVTFTSLEGSTYKIKHDCGCCPCCFGFSARDTAGRVGKYNLGGCCDAPFCGEMVIDGKFTDSRGERKFLLKHNQVCGDGCKICCVGCLNWMGCLSCYRYYCTEERYRLYLQPIYRTDHDVSPVAHFKYLDRIAGPCSYDERLSASVDPCDEVTEAELQLLSFYLVLSSGYASRELGCNWSWLVCQSATPVGVQQVDDIFEIHTRHISEKEANRANLISTAKTFGQMKRTSISAGSRTHQLSMV
mmetsp:Transcript_17560/g.24520  ORF Transcript_17560/g.24520 Transcript_17560/m.24520 type:complete len:367 (-) Transcript_17560:488-1588(-)|eukprot:CAMPEP_0185252696 /NCGR_PEP_ID=MMETSP1359-20130426/1710_1 /TAXON_ID=552665 /ORGANISM="Bigelowiella longifila, Strain CCMP242" /LENGTH=366 /DNA_ID=CAMNT_0027834929 /DNA_START=15 /DNA_END=1115 /DNA_ORIENTATION=-